ncbi:MAG: tetratricopeptide repeat protein [Planctomycetes bacterium]|nr:tetratricopeptide repeat protein [Planctomycetota bacterium]
MNDPRAIPRRALDHRSARDLPAALFFQGRYAAFLARAGGRRAASPAERLMRCESLAALGLRRAARREYRALLADRRTPRVWNLFFARRLLEWGEAEEALRRCRRVEEDPEAPAPSRATALAISALCCMVLSRRVSLRLAVTRMAGVKERSAAFLIAAAALAARTGREKSAQALLERALRLAPGDPAAHAALADLGLLRGDHEGALRHARAALRAEPERVSHHMLRGELFEATNRPLSAAVAFQTAYALSPRADDADAALLAAALCRRGGGDLAGARRLFRLLLARFPKSPLRAEARSALRAPARRGADVREGPERVRLRFPRRVQREDYCGPNTLANLLAFWGRPLTQEHVGKAVFDRGTPWHALRDFAARRGMLVTFVRARASDLRELLRRGVPVIVSEHQGLDGHFLAVIGFDRATDCFLVQDPRFPTPIEVRAARLAAWRRLDDEAALIVLPRSERRRLAGLRLRDADFIAGWVDAGRRRDAGHLRRARAACDGLLRERPASGPPRRLLVEVCFALRDLAAAESHCRAYLARKPRAFWAWKCLGDARYARGDARGAVAAYRRARSLYARDAELLGLLGDALRLLNRRREAMRVLSAAVRQEPGNARLRLIRARLYADLGRDARAREEMAVARDINADRAP